MGHSNSFNNVSNLNSNKGSTTIFDLDEIFDNCFNTDNLEDALNNALKDNPLPDQPKKESIGSIISRVINNWCTKNPGPSLALVIGGTTFICYKITVGMLSQAVFKGNLKTSRYFEKHAG